MLDVSDTTKGFLPPRMNTSQMNAVVSPADGLFVFNTDSLGYMFYNGSNWVNISTAGEIKYAIPAGTIIPFAGDKANLPSGFLVCDGSLVSTTTYSDLFAAISYSWGGSGANFNIPDLRGRFLRGVDDGVGNDPDAASRTAMNAGGNTGDNAGTLQGDENKSHAHNVAWDDFDSRSQFTNAPNNWGTFGSGDPAVTTQYWAFSGTYNNDPGQSSGGNESRPKNASVTYIICFSSSLAASGGSGGFQGNIDGGQVTGTISAAQVPASVSDSTRITDADGDTKIQVEESANEDIIRFDLGGSELFRMQSPGRIHFTNQHVYLGNDAGSADNTTPHVYESNVGIGFQANRNNVGNANVAIGAVALGQSTNAGSNVAVGNKSMFGNFTGSGNTAVGQQAMFQNVSGDLNVAIGQSAFNSNETGSRNILLGNAAFSADTSGNNNVAIGHQAGLLNFGSSNIFLGYQAAAIETSTSNKLYIENSNSATPLIYGDFAADALTFNGKLTLDSAKNGTGYTFPGLRGADGQVLTSDGAGNARWEAVSAGLGGTGTADYMARWSDATTLTNSLIRDDGTSIGISSAPTTFTLFTANTFNTSLSTAIVGSHGAVTSSTTIGVYGSTASSNSNHSAGVYGYAANGAHAIYGRSASTNTGAIVINALNTSGGSNENYGVKGQTFSTNAGSAGIYGYALHGGNAILAESNARAMEATSYGARSTSITAINLRNIATSSTASITKIGLDIQSTGSWTGASAINTGLNVDVSGGTTNYAALFNGGNVGIGTASPVTPLHISDISPGIRLSDSDASRESTIFGFNGNIFYTSDDTDRDHIFQSGAGPSTFAEVMRITGDGNVGIGTSTPSLNLVVADSTSAAIIGLHAASATQDAYMTYISNGSAKFVTGYDQSSDAFKIGTNIATTSFVMNAAGQIGLGIDNPTEMLHLSTASGDANILLAADADNNNEADNPRIVFEQDGGLISGLLGFEGTAGTFSTNTISNSLMLATTSTSPIQFVTDNEVRMTILDDGNVGIGTNNPTRRLFVESSDYVTTVLESDNVSGTWLAFSNTTVGGKFHHILTTGSANGGGSGEMRFGYGNSDATVAGIAMTIEDEKVGIGTLDPIVPLHVVTTGTHTVPLLLEGDAEIGYTQANDFEIVQVDGSGNITNRRFKISSTGTVTIDGGATTVTSDSTFKINVNPITGVLQDLANLDGVYHHWDTVNTAEGRFQSRRVIGMIAQKLRRVYPELVFEDEKGYLSVDYSKFTAVLLQAVKEQQVLIEQLQANQSDAKLQRIENEKLRERLEVLEKIILK